MLIDLLLVPFGASYGDMREAALVAEDSGFNGLWTFDHLREPVPYAGGPTPECWTALSALAEATNRLQLGPLVLNVGNRHPGLLANMAATLQEASGGRLVLGIGAGGGANTPYTAEQEMIGQPVKPDRVRAEEVAEAVQMMRKLWQGEETVFEGRHFHVRSAKGFLHPQPPPPVIVGGFGRRMASIAGRYGDGLNAPARMSGLPALIETARKEHAASERREHPFVISVFSGLQQSWLNPNSSDRVDLERMGVGRLILQVEHPYPIERIRAARAPLQASSGLG
jgi:alkanesulfonate monooxygenase SsuD/methylene tetrahydromethanopterin reductase-like flavin-dependent oxidoreductase (luciferase family)